MRRRFRKQIAALGLSALLLTAVFNALITSDRLNAVGRIVGEIVTAPFKDGPNEAQVVTNRLFRAVRTEKSWLDPPKMSTQGKEFFIDHFDQLDPRRPHPFRRLGPVLDVFQAATEGTLYAVQPVTVVGRVGPTNALSVFDTKSFVRDKEGRFVQVQNLDYASEIGPGSGPPPVIDCRYAKAAKHGLQPGGWAIVVGLIIANGSVAANNGETMPAATMACISVRMTDNPRRFFHEGPHSPASDPRDPLLR